MAAGSGAGSEKTTKGECSQAFICAVLDYFAGPSGKNSKIVNNSGQFAKGKNRVLGEEKNITYEAFVGNIENITSGRRWEKVKGIIEDTMLKITKISLPEIEEFLKENQDWFMSSINTANSLSVEIKRRLSGWNFSTSDYIYYRQEGSKNDMMDNIQDIFKIVNKANNEYFGRNINRWCPADIYIGKPEGEREIKELLDTLKKIEKAEILTSLDNNKIVNYSLGHKIQGKEVDLTFDSINYIFRSLVSKKLILPISLKKASSTFFTPVSVKMFNAGPPLMSAENGRKSFRGDSIRIGFDPLIITFGGEVTEKSDIYSSMDMYIHASKASAESLGFKKLKMQIRDKGSSTSNKIEKYNNRQANFSWKYGIQAITKLEPSKGQAGGLGGGALETLVGGGVQVPKPDSPEKKTISNIVSKFSWNGKKFIFDDALTRGEDEFIKKFLNLHNEVAGKTGKISVQGKRPPTSLKRGSEIMNFYLAELSERNQGLQGGKLKKEKIGSYDRYKVAQWFLTKYFCFNLSLALAKENNTKKLQKMFLSSLSMDKKGPSGKLGGGSVFYIKAGQ